MSDFIFSPTEKVESKTSFFYCLKGNEDFLDNDGFPSLSKENKYVLAKKVIKTDAQPQFFIKISNNNKLFNPLDAGPEDRSYSIVDNVCRPSDKFRSVNEKVFNMYLSFLSSKNTAWLNKAEREII